MKKNQDNLISIIVPMYNVSDYISECLESIQNQTYPHFECLLIDDGSTDDTVSKTKEFIQGDSRFKLIEQENGGPAKARNNGLNRMKGSYVLFVDSDDLLGEDSLSIMIDTAVEEETDIVIGKTKRFNSNQKEWEILGHVRNGLNTPGIKDPFSDNSLYYAMGPAAKLFKKELIENEYFDENKRFAEDQLFVFSAYIKAKKIQTVDYFAYYYRVRETDQSLTQTYKKEPLKNLQVLIDLMEETEQKLELLKVTESDKDYILTNYYNRLFEVEVRVLFKNMLLCKKEIQKEFLHKFNEFLATHQRYIHHAPNYYKHITREQLDYLFFVKGSAVKELIQLIQLSQPSDEMPDYQIRPMSELAKGTKGIVLKYKTKAFLRKVKSVLKYRLRKVLSFGSKTLLNRCIYPINKRKKVQETILFMSNKDEELGGSFLPIYNELLKVNPEAKVKFYLKKDNRNFSEMKELIKDVATAKYIFLDDYYRQLYDLDIRKETEVIQLWHAAGAFKKFSYSALEGTDANTEDFERKAHKNYTKVICSSEEIRPFYAEAFNVPESKVYALGTPRTDKLFDEAYQQEIQTRFLESHPEIKGRKIVTYAPTFRGGAKERQTFNNELDISEFVERFSSEYVLVVKMHPSVKNGIKIDRRLSNDVLDLSSMDMNDLLICTDILVTDYSSVIFDYSIMKKPMIFYAYDLEDYIDERSFYYDYESFVPGPIVKTNEELLSIIEDIDQVDLDEIDHFSNRFFVNKGNSAKKIVEKIFNKGSKKHDKI